MKLPKNKWRSLTNVDVYKRQRYDYSTVCGESDSVEPVSGYGKIGSYGKPYQGSSHHWNDGGEAGQESQYQDIGCSEDKIPYHGDPSLNNG